MDIEQLWFSESIRAWRIGAVVAALAVVPGLAAESDHARAEARQAAGQSAALAAAQALLATDAPAAIASLRELTSREPENVAAWRVLAQAQTQAQAFDEAAKAWNAVLGLTPDDPRAMYALGSVWARQGDSDRAFLWLTRAKGTGRLDMSRATVDPNLITLREDERFGSLQPPAELFEDPFVEPVRIIGEWRGEAPGDQFGWIARDIGDVDGDDARDFVTSAPTRANGGAAAGRVYVYSTKGGALLWHADGQPGDNLGQGLEAAGDVNGDGIPDVVAGAPGGSTVRVYSGRDGSILHEFTSANAQEQFGGAVAGGDVDGDQFSDIIVGAPGAAPASPGARSPDAGRVVVYSGRDGTVLVELAGERPGDRFGATVAGDPFGGSRFMVVGAPGAGQTSRGRAYVYEGLQPTAFTIETDDTGRALGAMFASVAGDVDGDGVSDIYVSDWANAAKGPSTGRVYVHSGQDGGRLFAWTGETAGEGLGTSASNAGDVDSDGYADFIVGAWQHGSAAISGGRAYLYSGQDGRLVRTFTSKTPGDTLGFDSVGIGDVDGDGTVDLLITAAWSAVKGYRSGRVFVISSGVRAPLAPVQHTGRPGR